MIVQPIVERELRVVARKAGTYWGRAGAALAAGAVVFWTIQTVGSAVGPAQVGKRIFHLLGYAGFYACLFSGAFLTANCLSQEKREGTLGLLFLTGLRSLDVVVGKLAANSLSAFFSLLAALPVLAVPLLLGGVTAGGFWRVALVLLNTLWFSLATGMFVSAVSWHQQRAMAGTMACVMFAGGALAWMGSPWEIASPQTPLRLAYDGAFQAQPQGFWLTLTLAHWCGWFLLLLANWLVLRSWRNPGPSAMQTETAARSLQLDYPLWSVPGAPALTRVYVSTQNRNRAAMLDRNPIEWLAGGRARWPVWLATMVGVLVCLFGNVATDGAWESSPVGLVVLLSLHGLLKGWIAWEATRRFTEEKRMGVLELMLVSPLSVTDILCGQLKSLQVQFRGPVLAVLGFDTLLILTGPEAGHGERSVWTAGILAIMLAFPVDLTALAWMGLNMSLETGKALSGAVRCVVRVMAIPTVVWVGLTLFIPTHLPPGWPPHEFWLLGSWLVVGLGFPIWFGLKARRTLRHDFRRLAAGD